MRVCFAAIQISDTWQSNVDAYRAKLTAAASCFKDPWTV